MPAFAGMTNIVAPAQAGTQSNTLCEVREPCGKNLMSAFAGMTSAHEKARRLRAGPGSETRDQWWSWS